MGTSRYTWIGPYLKIKLSHRMVVEKRNGCDNALCKYFHRNVQWNFCTECGAKCIPLKVPVKKLAKRLNLDIEDSHGLTDDERENWLTLWPGNLNIKQDEEILIPTNDKWEKSLFPGTIDVDFVPELNLDATAATDALVKFHEEYPDIKKIEEAMGKDNVQVKFGMVNYRR